MLVEKLLAVRRKEAPLEIEIEPAPATTPTPAKTETIPVAVSMPATSAVPAETRTVHAPTTAPATCVTCGATVSEKVRAYCDQHSERFGGGIYCFKHHRRDVPSRTNGSGLTKLMEAAGIEPASAAAPAERLQA